MRVRIEHLTEYHYDEPASLGPHYIRLRPADHARAPLLSYDLRVSPGGRRYWQQDPWGNRVSRLVFLDDPPTKCFSVRVEASFEIRPVNPFDFIVDERCEKLPFAYPDGLAGELEPFLAPPKSTPRLAAFVEANRAQGFLTDYLVSLNRSVANTVDYIIRAEPGLQTSEQTLELGRGSCRDSAVLLVDVLRSQGLAARFVSGYLVQLTDEGNIPDEAKGVDRDVVDLHAWAEVYVPGAGWIGLDGTSGLLCGEGHIPLAGTVDPKLAGPIEGTASQVASKLHFEMKVVRLGHEPRPRRPYTDEQWSEIRSCGRVVDEAISKAGLRLTMGGEPTWTSRLHPKEEEWNGEALGPTKWTQGIRLSKELLSRLGPGGILLHRFGKHYPGESLPRWANQLLWRRDRAPIWRDNTLVDTGSGGYGTIDDGKVPEGGRGVVEAERFAQALAAQLGLPESAPMAGFEDPWVFTAMEENLPVDVDPLKADLSDSEERRRLARVLNRGLNTPAGYAIPVARKEEGWTSSAWTFRRQHLFLTPGDSPMGLRLPLDRVGGKPPHFAQQDPSQRFERPLPVVFQSPRGAPAPALDEDEVVRTALCVEPRGGVLHVFLPPLETGEAFLELVAAVERVAAATRSPVSLEGYPPPKDPRLASLLVTPDPGVLEVNLPVTETFDEYVALMETVSDAANHSGLTAEKFQLDGRTAGPGGGHHLTLGGPSTDQSPFLVRPELFAGLLRYVQNHPSLSYLFTGLFVGPTSQAPRIDEARHDALYELEIALAQAERAAEAPCPPWLVDRLFRNLLVDVAGNTHRTEICIDKLYSPGLASGRQGIVELRAFEMPPHEQMAIAQMLLVRGLVARLAAEPYRGPLVRWGSQLHDRFMLPTFLWADLKDVLRDLSQHGLPFDEQHYQPFLDFKCPLAGRHVIDGVEIEVRNALEPWPVLGEEGASSGTVRFVDSSVERVEVKVDGITPDRHVVLANGVPVPLRETGRASEMVAGVRFRAWQPPHCLQPNIGVQHPLRFDLVDTWGKRSLGAVTYHVWHPDGKAFDEPPLTAFEAGARRAQRFTTEGHATSPVDVPAVEVHPEQPYTLDLRRHAERWSGAGS